ncbi:MAG: peptidylprolyl isomerase [Candidatus Woesearchaeota archaeon]
METKNHDFVEIEYTGKVDGMVFDTSDEHTAKLSNIYNQNTSYGPIVICLGESHVLPGLDKNLIGRQPGQYTFIIHPEDGFGKKSAKLLKLVPASIFKKQKVNPMPGLQINIDGVTGIIKTANGGRVIVDFNHPLSGKELEYEIKLNRVVDDPQEKIRAIVKLLVNQNPTIEIQGTTAALTLETALPEGVGNQLSAKIKELVGMEISLKEPQKPQS